MGGRVIKEQLVRQRHPSRDSDVEDWQALGPTRILQAAWNLVVTAASAKGVSEDQLRLDKSVEELRHGRQRRRSAMRGQ